jgi:hypothetical protein
MVGVLGLRRIVQYTERAYKRGVAYVGLGGGWEGECYDLETGAPRHLPDPDTWERTSREPFYRSVYRALLAGPWLSGWYLEPFSAGGVPNSLSHDMPPNLREFLEWELPEDDEEACCRVCVDELSLGDEDLAFLEKSRAFDQEANTRVSEKQDAIFQPLAAWLIQSMKEHLRADDVLWAQRVPSTFGVQGDQKTFDLSRFPGGNSEECKATLREVLRMLVAYENLAKAVVNWDDASRYRRETNIPQEPPVIPDTAQESFAIILGVYQLEKIQIAPECGMVASPAGRLVDGELSEKHVEVYDVQQYLYRRSRRANHVDDAPVAPPRLQLFTYILDRFFKLDFKQDYLWNPDRRQDYREYLANGALFDNLIFADDQIRSNRGEFAIIGARAPIPIYSYRPISWEV